MKILITVIVSVVVTLALVGGVGWWFAARAQKAKGATTKVRIENPEKGDLVEIVAAPGRVEPRTKVSISARVPARVEELPYEEGDRVTKGDPNADPPIPPSVLVRLDSTDLEAALRSVQARRSARAAEIEVTKARIAAQEADITGTLVSLEDARRSLARQEKLRESGDVSQSDYDAAQCCVDELTAKYESAGHAKRSQEMQLSVLQHQLDAADAEVAQARDKLSYTTITSPIDGIVTRLNAEVGELVVTGTMNNPGTVIMEVADLGQMLAVAEVDESDVGGLKAGQRAAVRIRAYPDREFKGVVDSVALTVLERRGSESRDFLVKILLDASGEQVYSGLSAEVEIETRRHPSVLKIPSQAVLGRRMDELPGDIRDGNPNVDAKKTIATVVYRCIDGKATVTPVVMGPSDTTHTIIRSGLTEDDRVVTGPYKVLEKLKHDEKIEDDRKSSAPAPAQTQPASAPSNGGAEAAPAPA